MLTAIVLIWFALRLPETLAGERVPFSVGRLIEGYRTTLTDRWSLGYTLAVDRAAGRAVRLHHLGAADRDDGVRRRKHLNLVFAGTAGMMAVANLLNSRLVMRLGSRFLSHSALRRADPGIDDQCGDLAVRRRRICSCSSSCRR